MEVKKVKISDLKFAEYNPRKISEKQMEDLKESIRCFGFVDPIVVNKNKDRLNVIVGGHQRVKAFKQDGGKEVPCVFVDLNLDLERELNVRLNRNVAGWDWEKLNTEFDSDELVDWGFSNSELDWGNDAAKIDDPLAAANTAKKPREIECQECGAIIKLD